MPNILETQHKEEITNPQSDIPAYLQKYDVNFKDLQFLEYFDIKEPDYESVEKIKYITSKFSNTFDLMEVDNQLGMDNSTTKLNKIVGYLKLKDMRSAKFRELSLISKKLKSWEDTPQQ